MFHHTMRLKKGSKVEVMNNEVRASRSVKKVSRGNIRPYQIEDDCLPVYNDARIKKRKRASPFEKDSSQSQRRSYEKVDAFEGNKYMQASYNYTLNGYYETEKKKRKPYGVVARIAERPNESDNDQCSVGSCSVVVHSDGCYNKLSSHYDADSVSSDLESFNTSRVEHEVAVSVHRLELHAYRSTLEALYASGPLSWDKEALLTNLRISLSISNDEHLTELRHLIASGARILD